MKTEKELIEQANEILRSCNSVIERQGKDTNWKYLEIRVKEVLKDQHVYMYPTIKQIRLEKLKKLDE
jgi:hypothetical protein